MKRLKKFLSIMIWPIIFMIGQFVIRYIFVVLFNQKEIPILKRACPKCTNSEINRRLLNYIHDYSYQDKLNKYLSSKALIIVMITFMIFFPLFLYLIRNYKSKVRHISIKSTLYIVLLGIFISISYNTFLYAFSLLHPEYNNNIIALIITTGLLGPILEELLFRGIVYKKALTIYNKNKAIVISSIIFSIFHLPSIQNVIYAFLLSFIFIYLYDKYKTLKISILFHMSTNMTILLVSAIIINNDLLLNTMFILMSTTLSFYLMNVIKKQ